MTTPQDDPPHGNGGADDTGAQRPPQQDATPTDQFPPPPGAAGGQAYAQYPPSAWSAGAQPPGQPAAGAYGYPPGQDTYGYPPGQGGYGWQGGYGYPPQQDPYGYPPPGQQAWPAEAFAEEAAPSESAQGRRHAGTLAAAAAALIAVVAAVVLILGFAWPGFFTTTLLDTGAAQNSIASVLARDYQISGVTAVRCPDRIEVSPGGRFTCDAVIDGRTVTVTSTFSGDHGDFVVSRPASS